MRGAAKILPISDRTAARVSLMCNAALWRPLAHWRARYPEGHLLLVGHAGLNRTLLAGYLALPLNDLLRIPQPYACRAFLPEW